ncbi:MAG: ABC transporter ATP-binding protein [Deltaproteobacteria bacterium]|nr:ABC transporter ATP-binding protein [Deltaproteobacteria bacterium]
MKSKDILIELDGIGRRFGAVDALSALSIDVPTGSIGLLGPNGAGKSTLIKIALGLLLPSEGRLRVLGFDPTRRPLDLRSRVGYMPENDCYINGLDAVTTCRYAGELCGLPRAEATERAHAMLEFVGLGDKRYLKVAGYSTGQKQRVKLAQALVHDPELLFLDEPTNGLDPRGRDEMLALIAQLPERSECSVILSSHLLKDVERVCRDVVVLNEGRAIYSGPIDALAGAAPQDFYEVRVKDRPEVLTEALLQAGCQAQLQDDGALHIHLAADQSTALIFERALNKRIQVRHLAPKRASLEDAFLSVLTQQTNSPEAER